MFGYILGIPKEYKFPASPDLLLVNTSNCNTELNSEDHNPILLASSTGTSFVGIETAAEWTLNWRNAITQNWSNASSGWVLDSVFAYTFKRDNFSSEMQEGEIDYH